MALVMNLLMDVILSLKKEGEFRKSRILKDYYTSINYLIQSRFDDEENFIEQIISEQTIAQSQIKEIKSWYNGLNQRLKGISYISNKLEESLSEIRPKLTWKTVYPRFLYWLNN